MSRYIDADKLRKDEIARCHCVPVVGSNDNNYKDLDEVLNDAPTADVEEVRHGEWIEQIRDYGKYLVTEGVKCSLCGFELTDNDYNYCPECGAKMDLEGRSENEG